MNICVPYCTFDRDQFARWAAWVAELGGVSKHRLYVMPAKNLPNQVSLDGLRKVFATVEVVPDWYGVTSDWSETNDPVRDASGANTCPRQFASHMYTNNLGPWLFCEADAVALCPEWLDRIEAEYKASGKRFMGAKVVVPNVPAHSTGNMVFPQDAMLEPTLMLPRHATFDGKRVEVAFDISAAEVILANFHDTKLIQHVFRGPEFTSREQVEQTISNEAVLFHADKHGSLLPFIREKLSGRTGTQREPAAAVPVLSAHATPTGKPKVFTYHHPAPTDLLRDEQIKLLGLWVQEWSKSNFDPVVLTEATARRHPKFDEWSKALLSKPTVNPPGYEAPAWTRHIAMAAIGGGLLVDYDVVPNGRYLIAVAGRDVQDLPVLLCDCVPCAVDGNKEQYEALIEAFIACEPTTEKGQPHLSDMHACRSLHAKGLLYALDLCREFGTPGFEQARLIHFSHATRHGKLRSELIEEWLTGKVNQALLDTAATMGDVTFPLRHGMHTCFRGMTADEIVDGLHQAPDPPTTRISKVRAHISALAELSDTPSRKILLMKELRKQGLIGKPKKRKRRKWKMLG